MSTGGPPDLVIPVRLDLSKLSGQLQQMRQSGTQATGDVAKGFDKAQKSAAGFGNEMVGLMKAQLGLAAVGKVAGLISQGMRESAEYSKKLATDFIATQKAMQSIAALSGKLNTNQFTVQQVRKGAAANLAPADWTQFADAFLSKASNYIGAKPTARLTDAEADKFQASMAEFAKLHGVSMPEMADFAGGLLAQEKGPTTAAAMTAKAGGVFATLEASSKKVSGLLPDMTRIMAQGMTAQQAAPWLAGMPEIAPGEEGTHLQRAINEVRQLDLEGKGGGFGIKEGMSMSDKLQAVVSNLRTRATKGGQLDPKALDTLLQGVTKESIAQSTLRGLVTSTGGVEQWQAILARTPKDIVATDIAAGRQSDAGQQMRAESQLALAEAESGPGNTEVQRLKMDALAQLTRERAFEKAGGMDFAGRPIAGFLSGTKWQEQMVNERAVRMAYERAGVPERARVDLPMGAHQMVADRRIRELLERQTQLMEKDSQPPPLSAPPRPANGARMGN